MWVESFKVEKYKFLLQIEQMFDIICLRAKDNAYHKKFLMMMFRLCVIIKKYCFIL